MSKDSKAIQALLVEVKRKALATSRSYQGLGTAAESDWPREAEIELIESLVDERAGEVLGDRQKETSFWRRCHDFANDVRKRQMSPIELQSGSHIDNDDRQRNYVRGEGYFFEGVGLWVEHTLDFLRYLDASSAAPVKETILFLAANPTDTTALRLAKEAREIREELERSRQRDSFHLEERGAVRPVDMGRSLIDLSPRYLHFSGHGGPTGAIYFEAENGTSVPVPPDALRALFKASCDSIHCVILNACYSADQAHVILSSVPFVIAMQDAIGDETAIAFARGFYRALGAGKSVQNAFDTGIAEIMIYSLPGPLIPKLLQR
jgi:hypothetical protein